MVLLIGHNPEANKPDETYPETDDRIKIPSEVPCEQKKTNKTKITKSQMEKRWGRQISTCTRSETGLCNIVPLTSQASQHISIKAKKEAHNNIHRTENQKPQK